MGRRKSAKPADRLTRRDFIKASGATAVAAVAASGCFREDESQRSERAEDAHDFDVIVVGGGFAGVTVARELGEDGFRVLLLEARDRLGGRTHTSEFAGHQVELGGTWIHWAQPHVWAEVTRYRLTITATPGTAAPQRIAYRSGAETHVVNPDEIWGTFVEGCDRFCESSREVFPIPYEPFSSELAAQRDGLSVRDRLQQIQLPPVQNDLVDAFWSTCIHNDPTQGGLIEALRWYALAGHDANRLNEMIAVYKFSNGTVSLLDAMIADGEPEVRLSTPVAKVSQNAEGVVVATQDGELLSARAAVVTVPLNTLKKMEFSPPLSPEKTAASEEGHCGLGTKAYVEVRGRLGDWSFLAPSPEPISYMFTDFSGPDRTILIAFGPSPDRLDVNDVGDMQRAVRAFLPDAEIVHCLGHPWANDPYSLGTWCTYRPLQMSRYLRELQRPEGRIVYAGADNATGWRGFIDGAIESGLRASREVKNLLS